VSRLIVLAKEPRAGRVKTRLCPPLTPQHAADLARASLVTTLRAVAAVPAADRVVALDGRAGDWLPAGFRVIPQRGDGHALRIAHAFADARCPAFLIGMDSPQVTPALLARALALLADPATDAVLGLADDGGWWGMGLRRADPATMVGLPMSRDDTGARQLHRLRSLGLRVGLLPSLADVDVIEDARAVARQISDSLFARVLDRVDPRAPVAT
jgi:hypothetical protein